jgi:predicted dehydrogenase
MRVLFCGLGGIGQRHLRNLRTLMGDKLEVHAYRVRRQRHKLLDDLTIAPDADVETDYQITVHTDLQQALAAKPALVLICNPSSLHTSIAIAAAKAGAHIFIEKPVSNTLDGLDELRSIITEKGLVCYVGYNLRCHPGLIKLKTLVEQRFFGNIFSVQAEVGEYLPNWHKYEDYRDMYAAREELGGGVILSQIHEMDLICWYFGLPATISCRGGKLSKLEINVEDTATSLMEYCGPLGKFAISLHQDFVQRPPARTFKIVGDCGIAEIDLIRNTLTVYNEQGEVLENSDFPGFKRNDMFLQQTKHLLDCLNGKPAPQVDLLEGMQSLRLALAAKRSLAT